MRNVEENEASVVHPRNMVRFPSQDCSPGCSGGEKKTEEEMSG